MELNLFFGPAWFSGQGILIDVFSATVLFLIAFLAYKSYVVGKGKNCKLMAGSMAFLGASFLVKLISFGLLYAYVPANITDSVMEHTLMIYPLFKILFILYAVIQVFAAYLLLQVYQKNKSKVLSILTSYLIIALFVFSSTTHAIFHLTLLIMFLLLTYQYYKVYNKNHMKNTKILYYAFLIITLSHVFFALSVLEMYLYVVAELIQFLGFAILLAVYIFINKNVTKIKNFKSTK